jgi:hypothetical protein
VPVKFLPIHDFINVPKPNSPNKMEDSKNTASKKIILLETFLFSNVGV